MQKVSNDVLWAAQILLSLKHAKFDPKPSSNVEHEAISEQQEHHQASNNLEHEPMPTMLRQQQHHHHQALTNHNHVVVQSRHQPHQKRSSSSTHSALKPKRSHQQQKRAHQQQKRTHQRKQPDALPPAPLVVERLDEIIMGEPGNPIKKKLTDSDVDKHYQRLMLRKKEAALNIESYFNHTEKGLFEQTLQIKVTMYDEEGKGYKMFYKGWNYGKFAIFGNSGWQVFSVDHRLKAGDEVELRVFRHAQTLRLCLICSIYRRD